MRSIRSAAIVLSLTVLVSGGEILAGWLHAQQPTLTAPANPSPYYIVNFVDITPDNKDAAVATLKQYVIDMRKESGNLRAEALVQLNRVNHFVVYEEWQNEAAFKKHEGSATTLQFRNRIGPMLGAPFDERPHFKLE